MLSEKGGVTEAADSSSVWQIDPVIVDDGSIWAD
jgi:hypothetical protein